MTDRYAELRAALDAATPGPWRALSPTEKHYLYYLTGDPTHNWSAAAVSGIGRALRFDAIYIAAANPEVIRALLAERDAFCDAATEAQAERDAARAERDALAAECQEQARIVGMGAEREARLLAERDAMEQALEAIEAWDPPQVLSKGEMAPMAVAIGSNGERDYFRGIARTALAQEQGGNDGNQAR